MLFGIGCSSLFVVVCCSGMYVVAVWLCAVVCGRLSLLLAVGGCSSCVRCWLLSVVVVC